MHAKPGDLLMRTAAIALVLLVACGPGARHHGDDDGTADGPPGGCIPLENTPELCSDGIDNSCNGLTDCADPSCSGIGDCPVCGQVEHPTGTPIDLPDGICGTNGDGVCSCTTDADCVALQPAGQHCFDLLDGLGTKECRQSYTSTVQFTGFGSGQKLMQVSDIVSVCINASHEWIRDLEIDIVTPDGKKFALDKFEGQTCSTGECEIFLGHPLNTDGDCPGCGPEMGFDYCWKPTATNPAMLKYADNNSTMTSYAGTSELPPGDYQSSDAWNSLIGTTLNGGWTISVTDLWPTDAGKIHSWQIAFNPNIVQDCSGPVIQ
jgi:hypothetical protein